jgi:hypothetical protein
VNPTPADISPTAVELPTTTHQKKELLQAADNTTFRWQTKKVNLTVLSIPPLSLQIWIDPVAYRI